MPVVESHWQRKAVSKMGSLACNGCSQLIFCDNKQLTELKTHMINIHKFVNKVNSIINLAFLNEAEEVHLDQLLQPRIKLFLETGNLQPMDVNVFERGTVETEEHDIPDIDESISDDEDDEFGEDELEEVQDMLNEDKLIERRLLEKLSRSVLGNVQKISEEKPVAELNEKYLENLMDKLRDDEEEEDEESDVDVKGGEEDNDSDTNPFSPEKTNPSKKTSNSQEPIQNDPNTRKIPMMIFPNRPLDALQMSTPISLVKQELVGSTQKAQVKIERTVVVDVIVEEVERKREKRMEADGGSLKREDQEDSPPSDFCRLCYCRFLDFSLIFEIFIFLLL